MKAEDYVTELGLFDVYLQNRHKPDDKRVISECEIANMFEFFIKNKCKEIGQTKVALRDRAGNIRFSIDLFGDNKDEVEEYINNKK